MRNYHDPVMVNECLRMLALKPGGSYVDATLGGGGHSLSMLQACPEIRLYAIDQDSEALSVAEKTLRDFADRVTLLKSNFEQLRTLLAFEQVKQIDGILYDLGVSSHQLDEGSRGFSFDQDAPLDMRMDGEQEYTAANAVNELPAKELGRIIHEYSEELSAGRIARAIEKVRETTPITTTRQLSALIESVVGSGSKESLKTKVRVFQALRIYVNRELNVLAPSLKDAINLLAPGGRIVVMSYHSLEDRIVKNVFRDAATGCKCPPQILNCVCGQTKRIKVLTSRPLTADDAELAQNIRSRSAKLRAAEKLGG